MAKPARKLSLASRRQPLAEPSLQREHLDALPLDLDFDGALEDCGLWPLTPTKIETFQINVGKLCNQTCRHCHVDAGPDRDEIMSRETMELCLEALDSTDISTVDITGGAPELNQDFRWLVEQCRAQGRHVKHRCNLTVLEAPSYRDIPEFLAAHGVEVICSLPHYRPFNTDRQRGEGVFEASIRALRRLTDVGYGNGSSGLRLVLVTNPVGAFLPAKQAHLDEEWKREMYRLYKIRFDALHTITNMPISRYLEWLVESENLLGYMNRLVAAFNPSAAARMMCRNTLSVSWDGHLFDCDFNQMLDLGLTEPVPEHVRNFDLGLLESRTIRVGRHCFGCAAGSGSSCGGATA